MSGTRIRFGEIRLGSPLPMDVYDHSGKLLLMRGQVLTSDRQLERLLEEGLYSEKPAKAAPLNVSSYAPIQHHGHSVSIFGLVREARVGFAGLRGASGLEVPGAVQAIADLVTHACTLDADATLASILIQPEGAYSVRHAVNCSIVGQRLVAALGRPQAEQRSFLCGLLTMNFGCEDLHDLLHAQEEPLQDEQKRAIREHPVDAAAKLRACGVSDPIWLTVVEQHHESVDGSGYPRGLRGESIHIAAQAAALADRYCASVVGRAYRPGLIPAFAMRDIFQKTGRGVAANLVALLIQELGLYPPGSVVELANGEVAVVIKRLPAANKPVVRSLRNAMRKNLEPPIKRLTSAPAFAVRTPMAGDQIGQYANLEELWADSFELESGIP